MVKRSVVTPLIALSFLFIVLSNAYSQLANTAWPKFQGDNGNSGRTSIVAYGQRRAWTASGAGGWGGTSSSIGADGAIYHATSTGLMAINPNGTRRWMHNGGPASCTAAIGADGTVYYGTIAPSGSPEVCTFYAVRPDGTTKWSFSVPGWSITSPVLDASGNLTFASPAETGYVYSLRADTGEVRWQTYVGNVYGSPALDSAGHILVGSTNGYLYALDSSGNISWHTWVGTISESSPAVGADGSIYIGGLGTNSRLYALNSNGGVRWSRTQPGMNGSPAIGADGNVYFISADGALRAYSSAGTALWSYISPSYHYSAMYFGSPVIDGNGTIYYTATDEHWLGALIAMNPNGTVRYSTSITSGLLPAAPTIGPQGQIYLGSGGEVIALVPEPSSFMILTGGVGMLLGLRRRRV